MKIWSNTFDGDSCLVIDNEIIYNSVIEFESTFLNDDDGKKKPPVALNDNNVITAFIEARGNLIGALALFNARLNSTFQDIGYLNRNGQFLSRKAINEGILKETNKYKNDIEAFDSAIEQCKENKNYKNFKKIVKEKHEYQKKILKILIDKMKEDNAITDMSTLSVEEQREIIRNRFIENRKWSYYNLYLTMVNIDAPKNLVKITPEQEKALYNSLNFKEVYINAEGVERVISVNHGQYQARFLKDVKEAKVDVFNLCGMNRLYDKINEELVSKINFNSKKGSDCCMKFINKINTDNVDSDLTGYIYSIYLDYKEINKTYSILNYKGKQDEASKLINMCDNNIYELLKQYESKEFIPAKAKALSVINPNSRFIIKYFFDVLEAGIAVDIKEIAGYKKDNDGEYELFYNRYSKKEVVFKDVDLHRKTQAKAEFKDGTMRRFKVNIRNVDIEGLDLSSLIIKDNDMYTGDMSKIGMIYSNSSSEFVSGEVFENIYYIENKNTYLEIYVRA